jgi:RNA polymerase sigma factor (sigma-70 family)
MKNYHQLPDNQLIKLFREGQSETMGILVERYKRGIYSSIVLLIKDNHLAEDLFQDTFIKIINTINKGGYADEGKFLPWAMRVAHNLCIDYIRKAKTRSKAIVTTDNYRDDMAITNDNAELSMIKQYEHKQIGLLIENLPMEQREVVVLRHYADLSFKEIAEMTNCSINTALGRMRYALVNLKKMMAQDMEAAA